jgi:diguanylate cyclase (GGDEF)-like protein
MDGALDVAERIRESIENNTMVAAGKRLNVTISAGVNSYRKGSQASHDWLIKEADMALYEAKRAGRNRVHRFEDPPASPWSLVS